MAQHALYDLKLGLKELAENPVKLKLLAGTAAGMLYLPLLARKRAEIDTLSPAVVDAGRPLAEELGTEDGLHDGFGLAIWYLSEAYRHVPGLATDLREALATVREKVISSRGEVTKPYPQEAARALGRIQVMPEIKPALEKFPVAVGGTLHDWVVAFNQHGSNLHELLAERGAQTAQSTGGAVAKKAVQTRAETVGVVGRFRTALADEIDANPNLPRDLDARIFGYFDELLRMREEREARAAADKTSEDPKATAAAGPAGDE